MNKYFQTLLKLTSKDEAYIVGGWLRDKILFSGKVNPIDLDIALSKDPKLIAQKAAKALGGTFITLDSDNKIYRVVLKDHAENGIKYLDFSKFRDKTIVKDLLKRDFTVNSLAMKLEHGPVPEEKYILDPAGGISDINKRIIRLTSNQALKDDPLRSLRAFRIAAELGFTIQKNTLLQIKKSAKLISTVSKERVKDELFRIFAVKKSHVSLSLIEKHNLLKCLIPEIAKMKRAAQKFYFHPEGLWQHSMKTLSSLEEILRGLKTFFPGLEDKITAHISKKYANYAASENLLKFVALFHDIAKPECAGVISKRVRFLGHEKKGAEKVSKILKSLKAGNDEIRFAKTLIENHMRVLSFGKAGAISERAYFRLKGDIGSLLPELVLLSYSDALSYRGLKHKKTVKPQVLFSILRGLMSRYFTDAEKKPMPKLADGNILMKKFKLLPGLIIGKLLKSIEEAQAIGKIKTQAEALASAEKTLTQLQKKAKIS